MNECLTGRGPSVYTCNRQRRCVPAERTLRPAHGVPINPAEVPLSPLALRTRAACLLLLGGLAFLPSRLPAAGVDPPVDPLLARARQFEKDRRWLDACRCYDDLLRKDRDQAAYRDGHQRCLRLYYLSRRHKDNAYHQALAKLSPGQALDVYEQ